MSGTESPSEGQLQFEQARYVAGRINVATPARVISYDPSTGYASVQPDLALTLRVPESDEVVHREAPIIEEVPVMWCLFGAKSMGLLGRLVAGDNVLLIISDKSIDEWKRNGTPPIVRLDPRRHNITDAYALAGGIPGTAGMPDSAPGALTVLGPDIRLGSTNAADPVVTQSRLQAELTRVYALLEQHIHTATGPTGPTTPPLPGLAPGELGLGSGPALGSPTVKAP